MDRRCKCGARLEGGGLLCRRCRGLQFGESRRKYHWTAELREELRRAYAVSSKSALTAGLDRLQRRTGWPRHALKLEAKRLGIVSGDHRREWTREEVEYLREEIGTSTPTKIARRLGRSVESVVAKADRMRLSRRAQEGYNVSDLALAFGVHHRLVQRWMDRGLLGRVEHNCGKRVAEDSVMRFLVRHVHEYDLRRVDQVWFKSMVFGGRRGG